MSRRATDSEMSLQTKRGESSKCLKYGELNTLQRLLPPFELSLTPHHLQCESPEATSGLHAIRPSLHLQKQQVRQA